MRLAWRWGLQTSVVPERPLTKHHLNIQQELGGHKDAHPGTISTSLSASPSRTALCTSTLLNTSAHVQQSKSLRKNTTNISGDNWVMFAHN
eukprot:1258857-Amphidinium_carterae.2